MGTEGGAVAVVVAAAAAAVAVDVAVVDGDDDVFQRRGLNDGIRAHCAREKTVLVHSCERDLHGVASRRGDSSFLRCSSIE